MKPFVISRELAAPRERVWQAWTEQERLRQWMSPKDFAVIAAKLDLRPGGSYHYGLRMPDGMEVWGMWVFREIKPPERLVFVQSFSDPQRGMARHPLAPDWPAKMLSTVSFEPKGKGTLLTIQWQPIEATEVELKVFDGARPSMTQGWSGTFEKLTAYLQKG